MSDKNKNATRRDFLKIVGAGTVGLAISKVSAAKLIRDTQQKWLLYIGTYTSGKSEGIYVYQFDSADGKLMPYKIVKNVVEPSFLVIDEGRKFLYAVNETIDFQGKASGAISAFAINQEDGGLQFLNQQPSLGGAPCYVTISKNSKFLLAANYVGGNVAVFPIEKDGKLGVPVDLEQHHGSSVNRERQEAAHAHSILLDSNNKFAYACDLGADKIFIYGFDANTGKLLPNAAQPFFQAKPGAGPRHLTFHKHEKFAFVINELDSTVTALSYNNKTGELKEIQTVSTLPPGFTGTNTCADIHIAPNGKFLYGSNRGHDSIVSFKIDSQTGKLEYLENVSTGGKKPRNFAIDPTGNFLLAANQDSDNISVFRIEEASGKLKMNNQMSSVPTPVCLKFISSF
ncbi:MAG: lactonase family protein [Pyrinomonadaceae bacterium]